VLTEERTSPGNYYYLFDGLGSTVALTDSNGNVAATYHYDPYGQVIGSTGTVFNPWLFAATYYDSGTKLYKMGARYYDPGIGRFTQEDPVPAGQNLYVYVGDNPIDFTDPSGLLLPLVIAAVVLIGAVAGGYLGYQWGRAHHYSAAGTVAVTTGGAVVGGTVGRLAVAAPVVSAVARAAGVVGGVLFREIQLGSGRNWRLAPLGNRFKPFFTHYHRRNFDPETGITRPGGSLGRHRPWDVKDTDTSFWDRF
jgi:RHS repeat-associated protein